ncbi:hypothetical protein [Nostoc sp.]|uniref:hypothetical protein n=1 Tax=Nostoc sp. TaxID=1180 RepID=UPI002FF5C1E2
MNKQIHHNISLQKQLNSLVIKRIFIIALFFITFTLGVVGLNANVKAENKFSCTNAILKDLYGVQIVGFRLTAKGNYIPFGATNVRNFDGKGNYSGTGITNISGAFSKINISGTYTVNPNCTVELSSSTTSTNGIVRDAVQFGTIVGRGREIITLQTSPDDNVQTGIFKKVVKAQKDKFSCTNAALKGLYGVQGSGFRLPTEGSYVPFGATNVRNFDGKGNYSGKGITNVSGTFTKTNISGTYTVNPDCTIELNDATTSTEGVVRNFSQSGTIVNSGREILTLQTSPDDNVQTGIFKKVW